MTEEERSVANFTSISSSNAIVVKVSKGDTPKVVVRTDSNLLDHIKTEVEGGELKVYIKGSIQRYSELMVLVNIPEINALRSSSASKILCKDKLEAENFSIRSSSAASASDANLWGLEAENVEAKASSAANIKVSATQKIKAKASSGADISYTGEPATRSIQESSGGDVSRD